MSMSLDGLYSQYSEMYTSNAAKDSAKADKLKDTLATTDYSKSTEDELMEVCKEFEAYFTEQVFKSLERMVPESDEESSSTSSYMDYFGDMLTQEYAKSSTESNNGKGLGIAQMLYEQMKRNYGLDTASTSSSAVAAAGTAVKDEES
ncbi:MAG: rod-binding protein [Lachnospiraceae bacterium]|nr:rod-binding protein [Lachnospiraceae bacterium]